MFVAATGCMGTVGYSGRVYVPPPPVYSVGVNVNAGYNTAYVQPELVEVSPGVQVVYDYDEPIFYSDNYYWRNYNNTWYRSSVHNGNWVVYGDVPYSVRGIQQPRSYVHYRPTNYTPRNYNNGGYRAPQPAGPTVRDHRYDPQPQPQPQPGPTVRDHRYDPQPAQPVGPTVRDHRAPQPQPQPQPGPTVRDHRHDAPAPPAGAGAGAEGSRPPSLDRVDSPL
ncbi:MAG: hypothetical protein NT062_22205 [Proteobacteria bacterium]|nr:hypothetical protein [Pseudomonadota bacterium]